MSRVCMVLLLAMMPVASPCAGISGWISDNETGGPVRGVVVRAYAAGRSVGQAVSSDKDGGYRFSGIAAGRYAVCIAATDGSSPRVASVVVRGDGEAAEVDFGLAPSTQVEGDSWVQAYPVFYQGFRASGLGVTGLRLKGFGAHRVVEVQVLDGTGPLAKPVGPSRTTTAFGSEGSAWVYWAGGEVPTRPGADYTLRLRAVNGQGWQPGVAGKGDIYAGGSAWFGAQPRPLTDLGFALCEENDGLSVSYAAAVGPKVSRVRAAGQTFVARSSDVLFASAALAPINNRRSVYVRFSIHETGPRGKQMGPSKTIPVSLDAAVAWVPGEVRVTPGKTYYLHIESTDGALFLAFEQPDGFGRGVAFHEAVPDPGRDIAGWVVGTLSPKDQAKLMRHPMAVGEVRLVNPSFEDGEAGWKTTTGHGNAVGCNGVIPAWGQRMFGWTNRNEGENSRVTIYQNVGVAKGRRYSLSGSVCTDHVRRAGAAAGGRSSDQRIRLVVDPMGGGQFSRDMESSQWYATEGEWRRGSVEFVAKSDRVSVGFELEQRWSLELCSLYVDGARLDRLGGAKDDAAGGTGR